MASFNPFYTVLIVAENGEVYTYKNGEWIKVANSVEDLTEEDFEKYGLGGDVGFSLEFPLQKLKELGNKIGITTKNFSICTMKLYIEKLSPQVMVSKTPIFIDGVNDSEATIHIDSSGGATVKVLFSHNLKSWIGRATNGDIISIDIDWSKLLDNPQIVLEKGFDGTDTIPLKDIVVNGNELYIAIATTGNITVRGVVINSSSDNIPLFKYDFYYKAIDPGSVITKKDKVVFFTPQSTGEYLLLLPPSVE